MSFGSRVAVTFRKTNPTKNWHARLTWLASCLFTLRLPDLTWCEYIQRICGVMQTPKVPDECAVSRGCTLIPHLPPPSRPNAVSLRDLDLTLKAPPNGEANLRQFILPLITGGETMRHDLPQMCAGYSSQLTGWKALTSHSEVGADLDIFLIQRALYDPSPTSNWQPQPAACSLQRARGSQFEVGLFCLH